MRILLIWLAMIIGVAFMILVGLGWNSGPSDIRGDSTKVGKPEVDTVSDLKENKTDNDSRITQTEMKNVGSSETSSSMTFDEFIENQNASRPAPPQALQGVRFGERAVELTWFDDTVFNVGFNVYRRQADSEEWKQIGRLDYEPNEEPREWFTFFDENARVDTEYMYVVTAVSFVGNESEYSTLAVVPAKYE